MRYYTGLDISMKETAICIVDQEGKIIQEGTVETDPLTISNYLKESGLPITKVALESGCLSGWLLKELLDLSLPVICVDARHIAAVLATTINKTDKNDARGIANAVRCNMYREVHPKSSQSVELKTLLAARRVVVSQRVEITNTIRGLLKAYGIRISVAATTNMFIDKIREVISELSELVKFSLEELINTAEILHNQIKVFDKVVKKLAEQDEDVKLLRTATGIGPITAISYKMEIDDPNRFAKSRTVGAYLGMTPTQYSSGESHKQGRISKCGSKELRHLLMEAGFVVLTRSKKWSKLKAWGMRLMKRHGLKKAALAVGRKLAVIMHRMLITREEFRYGDEVKDSSKTNIVSKKTCLAMVASA